MSGATPGRVAESPGQPIGLAEVNALRRAGLIDAEQYVPSAQACRDDDEWSRWALRALLALGAGHLLAGIIFFFAFNWDSLSAVGKFGVLEGTLVACVVAALLVGFERLAGQALLVGATVVTGVLLAVIGQVYQTGADAWQLFATWALVTLPFALASRSAAHWLVWVVVAYIAANLYGFQVLVVNERLELVELSCLTAVAIALALAAREMAVIAGADWLTAKWTRLTPAFAAPATVFMEAVGYMFGADTNLVAAVTFVVIVAALAGVYLKALVDFAVVAIATGFAALYAMAIGARVIQEVATFDPDNAAQLLFSLSLLTLWCAGVTTGTVKALNILRRRMRQEKPDD